MNDIITIYREDAIKAFTVNNKGKRIPYVDCDNFPIEFPLEYIVKTIKELPSADRPQGKWEIEYHGNGWNDYWDYICSNCGKKYERADAVLYKANFCPNCGAQMKGADDE